MKIYSTVSDLNAAEGAMAKEQMVQGGPPEADWAYRLSGAGAPGGKHGWLVTFLLDDRHGATWDLANPEITGLLIAYEILNDSKTGRVGVLRRNWNGALDAAELQKLRAQPDYKLSSRYTNGEYDIDVLDRQLPGPVLH